LITKSYAKENIALIKKDLIKYDPTKIHEAYDQWPQIAKIAYENQNCIQYDFKKYGRCRRKYSILSYHSSKKQKN